MTKSEFYDMYGSGFDSLCIGSERDPRKHAQMKKSLSAAFSTKALAQQESIVMRCVDGFVQRLGAEGASEKGLNMTKWFEMIAFDILGEMGFGETFHCVENGKQAQARKGNLMLIWTTQGKPHFWSEMIVQHLFFVTVLDNLRRYPLIAALGRKCLPRLTVSVRDRHSGYSRAKVARQVNLVGKLPVNFANVSAGD